jgi:hypothetical protein
MGAKVLKDLEYCADEDDHHNQKDGPLSPKSGETKKKKEQIILLPSFYILVKPNGRLSVSALSIISATSDVRSRLKHAAAAASHSDWRLTMLPALLCLYSILKEIKVGEPFVSLTLMLMILGIFYWHQNIILAFQIPNRIFKSDS